MSYLTSRERHQLLLGAAVWTVAAVAACVPASVSTTPGAGGLVSVAKRAAPAAQSAAAAPVAVQPLNTQISVTASEFKFDTTSLSVPAGQPITLRFTNSGVVDHDFSIPSINFKLSAHPGSTATGTFTLPKAGTYAYDCSIPGHAEAGMKGSIQALDPAAPASAQPAAAPTATGGMSMAMSGMGMPATTGQTAQDQGQAPVVPLPAGLKPLPQPQVAPPVNRTQPATVTVDLKTQEVTALLADGMGYTYYTFNGTVPGPMIRVRQGDTVIVNLDNDATSQVTHSIDLHAVSGPGGGAKVMQIPPDSSGSFSFKALQAGVYVYHCATPIVSSHIANGMYGLIVVEPPEGLPKVDHEYYVMQGEFYLQGDRTQPGLRTFSLTKDQDERPDYVLFNGGVGALSGANALTSNVGDTVRIFFGDGGPNLASSFHIIGQIFDRVYQDGSLANPPLKTVQTTLVPPGGATMVELTTPYPGSYTLVDHSIERMDKGASATLTVSGDADPSIFQSIQPGTGGTGGH